MFKNNQLISVLKGSRNLFPFCQNWKSKVLFLGNKLCVCKCKGSYCYYYWNLFAAAASGGRQKTFRNLKVISSRWDHGPPSWICSWWRNASSSSRWGKAWIPGRKFLCFSTTWLQIQDGSAHTRVKFWRCHRLYLQTICNLKQSPIILC